MTFYIKMILYTVIFHTTVGQTYNEMDFLLGYLFNQSRYNAYLRPLENQSLTIKVNITQYISSIDRLDISSSELLISGYFEIKWTDTQLTWDPTVFKGRSRIQLPKGKYWKPDFYLTKGAANEESSIYSSGFAPAWVTYQGLVMITPGGSYKTKCDIDTTFYPFDMHTCKFQFIVSNHDATELLLHSPLSNIDVSNIQENGEWVIKEINTTVSFIEHDNIRIPMFQCSIFLKRRAIFELINSVAPITLMFYLNIATCFVRPDSGERISFAITLYLSLVFATIALIERIPNNSLKMPLISYQHLAIIFINTVGVSWSIFIVNYASKFAVHQGLPNFLLKMVIKRRLKKKSKTNVKHVDVSRTNGSISSADNTDISFIAKEKEGQTEEQTSDITGLEVAEILDLIYFWVIMFCIIILSILFSAISFKGWFN